MKFKYRYIVYGSAALLAALLLVILLPIDDELNPEAVKWREFANDTRDVADNGYYYLIGFMAAADEDPENVGRDLIAAHFDAEKSFLASERAEFVYPEYPKDKALSDHVGEPLYCRISDEGCFVRWMESPAALRRELVDQNALLERYRRLLQFTELKPLIKANFYELHPPYALVVSGHRLNQMAIIVEHLSGNRSNALEILRTDMEAVRRHLASAHNLIGKMVMLAMLANDLDLLLNIAESTDARDHVPALTVEERSLHLIIMREFSSILNSHTYLMSRPASFDEILETPYGWLLHATFRPNMSANEFFPYYLRIAELSLADPAEFNRLVVAGDSPVYEPVFRARNIGGSILNSITALSLVTYIARLHDVDAKIALINAALALDEAAWTEVMNGERVLEAVNPYNPSERPHVDPATRALCFNGPFPDEANRRCIRKGAM